MVPGILKKILAKRNLVRKVRLLRVKARILKHLTGGIDMNEVAVLRGAEPRKILQTAIDKEVPAIMSYLSKRKWHVAKVLLSNLGANRLDIEVSSGGERHPMNIRVNQPVGISLKYEYGKFIFETNVVGLEPSPDATSGGKIVLAAPDRIEIVQRRSYFRVDVPQSLRVNVLLWHRGYRTEDGQVPPGHYWQGKLVDISAGGAQIVVDIEQKLDFRKNQFIGLRFTPMPYETPLMLNAQIRTILPTANGKNICLGLQIVGLEASPEGRQVLQRLCNVVERYYQVNQTSLTQQDFQGTPSAIGGGLRPPDTPSP